MSYLATWSKQCFGQQCVDFQVELAHFSFRVDPSGL
jgi:hypothetical protein